MKLHDDVPFLFGCTIGTLTPRYNRSTTVDDIAANNNGRTTTGRYRQLADAAFTLMLGRR